jgi:hypothetical protein
MRPRLSATTSAAWLLVCAGGLVGTLASGCGIPVDLGFPPDNKCNGAADLVIDEGESVPDPDGCNTCTCKGGELVCTELACNPCDEAERPSCGAMPVDDTGCTLTAECGPDGWQCVDSCPCASLAPISCPAAPPGCYYEGPFCDGQAWTCGALVCSTCEGEMLCEEPTDPGCLLEPYCDEQTLTWVCNIVCPPCDEPMPTCGGFSVASCSEEGWACENETCGLQLVDCPPWKTPECQTYMECSQNGWLCQETCDPVYCPDMPPPCETIVGPPNCSYTAACTSQGWTCAESCL